MKVFFLYTALILAMRSSGQPVVPYLRVGAYDTMRNAGSVLTNPAGMAGMNTFSAFLYGERKYLLEALSMYQLGVVVPGSSGNFGFSGTYFGSALYNRSGAGLAYARKLASGIAIGVQFHYAVQQTAGYATRQTLYGALGLSLQLSRELRMGIHASNPVKSAASKQELFVPSMFTLAFSYRPSEHLLLQSELMQQEQQPFSIHAALHYQFAESLHARAGITTAGATFYFGGGVLLREFGIDAVLSVHPRLGITPGLMIRYRRP